MASEGSCSCQGQTCLSPDKAHVPATTVSSLAEYAYRKHHPALQWLPTKLAE